MKGRPHGFLVKFWRGFSYPFRGVRVLFSDGKVALAAAAPFLICLVLYVAFFVAAVLLVDKVVDLMIEPGTWWRAVLRVLLMIVLMLGFFLALVFTYTLTALVLGAPFYDVLSGRVESQLTGEVTEEPFTVRGMLGDIGRGLIAAVVVLGLEVFVFIFGLLFVPVTTAVAMAVSAVLVAMEHMEPLLGRRRFSLRDRFLFLREHFWEMMGMGLPILLAVGVPLVGALAVPVGVIAGTILFVEARDEAVPEIRVPENDEY